MTAHPDAGVRVLFVDRDRTVADAVAEALERTYDAVALPREPGVDEALERLARTDVDCVACAHDSEVDGLALLEAVRGDDPDLPVVLYSAEGDEQLASDALASGVTDYVPIARDGATYTHLATRVGDAIERRRSVVSYREVFEKTNVGLTVRDVETGEILDANERYCELLGYTREELRTLSLGDLTADVPGYTPERARAELRATIEEGPRTFEWPDRTADGDLLWVEVGLNAAEIEGRRRILGTVRDITARREREEALRESEERFRSLFERSVDAIYLHDDDGVILDANPKACEHHGFDRDELVGMHVWDVSEDADPEDLRRMWAEMDDDDVITAEVTHRRADGSTFPVEVRVGTVDLGDGERFMALAREVTERVERERELEQQNERLEEFASVVSHDLRNPLSVVAGSADLARETGEPRHLDAIEDAVGRMERLIDDLLTLARQGETIGERKPVALDRIATESWDRVVTGEASLEADVDGLVEADEKRLVQAFENLYRNSVEHAGPAPRVRVGALPDGFYVEDDGPGIPADERDRVAEWGFSPAGGSGVGLSVVAEIAEAHGWSMAVTAGEDGGARFEFTGVEWY